jgi:hypothetical protein
VKIIETIITNNVQKRNSREVARKGYGSSHGAANQLLSFASLVLATALVGFNEWLSDAQRRRKCERASQLLGSRYFNRSFIQLRHFLLFFRPYNSALERPAVPLNCSIEREGGMQAAVAGCWSSAQTAQEASRPFRLQTDLQLHSVHFEGHLRGCRNCYTT